MIWILKKCLKKISVGKFNAWKSSLKFFRIQSFIKIAVMLSFPSYFYSASSSLQTNHSKSSYNIFVREKPSFSLSSTNYRISSGYFYSQTPSQPIRIKSVSSWLYFKISGKEVTICCFQEIFLLSLKSRSPMLRDTFKHPLILPSSVTTPPAF